MTPRAQPGTSQPSALSLLFARRDGELPSGATSPIAESQLPTPTVERPDGMGRSLSVVREVSVTSEGASHAREEPERETSDESVPLLADLEANHRTYHTTTNGDSRLGAVGKRSARGAARDFAVRVAKRSAPVAKDALRSIPAVILGTLLNILDGISCEYLVTRPAPYGRSLTNAVTRRYDHIPRYGRVRAPRWGWRVDVLREVSYAYSVSPRCF